MSECICNSCKNLKQQINEDTGESDFVCKFGYPSEQCNECEGGECVITACCNYIEDNEDEVLKTVYCKGCGKEMKQVYEDGSDGEVYCVNCYLESKEKE